MIILELKGGIGNQLFQFAHGLQVAHKMGLDVKAIARFSRIRQGTRPFSLFFKNLKAIPALPRGVISLPQKGWTAAENRGEHAALTRHKGNGKHLFFDGYYQSSRFFPDVVPRLVEYLSPHCRALLDKSPVGIPLPGSLSIHVRRGDYLRYPAQHPFAGAAYYQRALAHFKNVKFTNVYVFSDDLKWCKAQPWLQHVRGLEPVFVDASGETCLALMSCCDTHIIANSTLSWWGAFLAQQRNADTRVVAPKQWFGPAIKHDTSDMYEPAWHQL